MHAVARPLYERDQGQVSANIFAIDQYSAHLEIGNCTCCQFLFIDHTDIQLNKTECTTIAGKRFGLCTHLSHIPFEDDHQMNMVIRPFALVSVASFDIVTPYLL